MPAGIRRTAVRLKNLGSPDDLTRSNSRSLAPRSRETKRDLAEDPVFDDGDEARRLRNRRNASRRSLETAFTTLRGRRFLQICRNRDVRGAEIGLSTRLRTSNSSTF